jgi:hypothetical protein
MTRHHALQRPEVVARRKRARSQAIDADVSKARARKRQPIPPGGGEVALPAVPAGGRTA